MANFPLVTDFVYEEIVEFHTLVSEFENGSEQRRNKWASGRRKFKCMFKNRPKTDFTSLIEFFEARDGAYDSFNFTNPNDTTVYVCRFDGDTFNAQNKAYNLYDFEANLIEVK